MILLLNFWVFIVQFWKLGSSEVSSNILELIGTEWQSMHTMWEFDESFPGSKSRPVEKLSIEVGMKHCCLANKCRYVIEAAPLAIKLKSTFYVHGNS